MANLMQRIICFTLCVVFATSAFATRIKDLTTVSGVRSNQLVGYGLVVGLDGTGDQTSQTPFTVQSFRSMLHRLGVTIPAGINIQLKNVAAVALSADLPAFAKPGQTIDVTVSSIANAKSLRGGTLLLTPLKGADGQVYALAQGNLVVGGFGAQGADGSKITVNIPSVGRIPNGASVERAVENAFAQGDSITLNLSQPDFTTAKRVSDAINHALKKHAAIALDATSIQVKAPLDAAERVSYLSFIENLNIHPGEAAAKIIVNARTGTIVMGHHIRVLPAAVTHGSLVVTISEHQQVSQPAPLSNGTTTVTDSSSVSIDQQGNHAFLFQPGASLKDVVNAINKVGAAPGDVVAILEALKQAGALEADLEVI